VSLLAHASKFWLGVNGHLDKLGAEPDSEDFTLGYFQDKLKRSRGQIKPLLMKQEFIAGLGNAYTDEALFRAKIRPEEKANTLTREQVEKLHQAIRDVLPWGIEEIRKVVGDKVLEDEDRKFMNVYRREHQPCPVCQTKIVQTRIGGRDTFYCPKCQQLSE
ncbi:Fpg/Nei family DNA glycosylase, partial [Patescibacteria group bacterium]